MRLAVPALLAAAAAFSAPAAAQHPAIYPALLAAEVIGGLALGAAEAGPGLRGGYHAHHGYGHGYAAAGGAYVQYYDPRSGVPVGGPVPVGEREFQRRAAAVPYDAPHIRVRPEPRMSGYGFERAMRGPRVVDERIEPVMRGPRHAHGFGYRHLRHGYGMGPRYGHVPRVAYGPRYGYGARHAGPGYVTGPRFAYGQRHAYGPRFAYGPRHGMGRRYGIGPRYGMGPRVLYGPRQYHGWRVHGGHGPRVTGPRHHGPVMRHRPRADVASPGYRPAAHSPRGERSIEQMWNPGGQRRS